jgi:hypothetical protein
MEPHSRRRAKAAQNNLRSREWLLNMKNLGFSGTILVIEMHWRE